MNTPQSVKAVYAELKASLGDTERSAELLECATLIVEVAKGKERRRFGVMTPRATFDELPLDVILSQWQWRLVVREYRSREDDDAIELYRGSQSVIDSVFQAAA